MFKRYILATFLILSFVLVLSVSAQDDTAQEPIPVSGTFDYMWEELAAVVAGDTFVGDYTESEIWTGDFDGTADSPFLFVQRPNGSIEAWLYTEFEGTVLGDYEGTFVMMAVYKAPSGDTEWHGEWVILSGTDDLTNLRGFGTAWGPGSSNEDDGITDIYYSGAVTFVEPATEE